MVGCKREWSIILANSVILSIKSITIVYKQVNRVTKFAGNFEIFIQIIRISYFANKPGKPWAENFAFLMSLLSGSMIKLYAVLKSAFFKMVRSKKARCRLQLSNLVSVRSASVKSVSIIEQSLKVPF